MNGVEKQYYSIEETARYFGCSSLTVRRWVKKNLLPSLKLGGRRLIPITALLRLHDQLYDKEVA